MTMVQPKNSQNQSYPRAGRRERRRVETRDKIFRAALDLFAKRGFMETTVEDITEAADVGKGTFFNYFPTKEHVLGTYGAERVATVERALERARATDGPIMEVIHELAIGVAGQSAESPALLRAMYAAHATDAAVRTELQARMQTGRRMLAKIFRLAQQRGEVRKDIPAGALARQMQLVFHGVMSSWALNPTHSLRVTTEGIWNLFAPMLVPSHSRRTSSSPRGEHNA
jgi:AcrR family transcriptional regulator